MTLESIDGDLKVSRGGGEEEALATAGEVIDISEYRELESVRDRLLDELGQAKGEMEAARLRHDEVSDCLAGAIAAYGNLLRAANTEAIPDLIGGGTVEELDASLGVARQAFARAKEQALRELAAVGIPAGGDRATALDIETLSPSGKIAHALRRAG